MSKTYVRLNSTGKDRIVDNFKEKELYKREIIELVEKINNQEKGELLYRIISIVEVLPTCECQRVLDYLSELYLS